VELEPDQLGGGGRVGDLDTAGAARWRGSPIAAAATSTRSGGGGAAVALAGAVLEVRAALVLDVAQELGVLGAVATADLVVAEFVLAVVTCSLAWLTGPWRQRTWWSPSSCSRWSRARGGRGPVVTCSRWSRT